MICRFISRKCLYIRIIKQTTTTKAETATEIYKNNRTNGCWNFCAAALMKHRNYADSHSNSGHDHQSNYKYVSTSTSNMNIISRLSSVFYTPPFYIHHSSSTTTRTPLPTPQLYLVRSILSHWRACINRHRTHDQYKTLGQMAANSIAHSRHPYRAPPLAQASNYIAIPVVDHD